MIANTLTETIEYTYSHYDGIDDIILDMAKYINNGFTITKISNENAITYPDNMLSKVTVYFNYVKK